MICSVCGGNVLWMGPWGSLSHTECQKCGGKNCQLPNTEGKTLMKCRKCESLFDPSDSTGGCEGIELCQDCWERDCDDSWWEMMRHYEPTGEPDQYRLVGSVLADATLSECGRYRYLLTRKWGGEGSGCLVFVMLNPSTADASKDDQTIRKCIGFAKREGVGGILVVNVYAWRATDPKELNAVEDPEGPMNWACLKEAAKLVERYGMKAVAAWGRNDVGTNADAIIGMFGDLWCLGTNGDGSPKHPCYLANNTPLIPFTVGGRRVA